MTRLGWRFTYTVFYGMGAFPIVVGVACWLLGSGDVFAFSIVAALMFAETLLKAFLCLSLTTWKSVELDKIKSFENSHSDSEPAIECVYQFTVEGRKYKGTCIDLLFATLSTENGLKFYLQYFENSKSAWYWPRNPNVCCLEKPGRGMKIMTFVFPALFLMLWYLHLFVMWPQLS